MALIIPHQSRQGIATANAGGAATFRSASTFMTPGQENLGRGMRRFAAGMDRLNGVIFDAEIKERQEAMELELLQDMQNFQSSMQKQDDDYRQTNQGQKAINAASDAQKRYDEGLKPYLEKWKGNAAAWDYLQRHGGSFAVSGVNAMRDYGTKQLAVFKDSVFAGEKAIYENYISDPARTSEEIGTATRDFASKYTNYSLSKGLDPTAARQETRKVFQTAMAARSVNSINTLIDGGNLGEAGRLLNGVPRYVNLPRDIAALADAEAERQGVSSDLVKAVIMQESGGRTDAVSRAGAVGVMQLMPDTAKEMGVTDSFDATRNIRGGVGYLKKMLMMFDGDERAALIAYNAGPGDAKKILAGKIPMPGETKDYLNKVLGIDDKSVSAFIPLEKKMALEKKLAVAEERQKKIAAEQTIMTAYTAISGAVKDAPTLTDQDALFRTEAAKIQDRDLWDKVLDAWKQDYTEKENLRDATDMALKVEMAKDVETMTVPERESYFRENWRGSPEGLGKALPGLIKPPVADTREAVADYDKLLIEIDERNRGDT